MSVDDEQLSTAKGLIGYKALSNRVPVLHVHINAAPFNISFLHVHAPVQYADEEIFYEEIEEF